MTKRAFLLLFSLATVACANAPESFMGTVTPPGDAGAYDCAVQQLNVLGYTVEAADRDAGFVRAVKQTSGLGTLLLLGRKYSDLMTASVFEDPSTGATTLRVTVGQVDEGQNLLGSTETVKQPADSGREDAHTLLTRCGVESVLGPGGSLELEALS